MDTARYEESIRKLIAQRGASSLAERAMIYAAARGSVTKSNPDFVPAVDQAIANIEGASEAPTTPARRTTRYLLVGGVSGLVLGLCVAGLWNVLNSRSEASVQLEQEYEARLDQVQVAIDFLREVTAAVVKRQKDSPESLSDPSPAMVLLRSFSPELAGAMPKSLPRGTTVVLRADAKDYKVLMNWPLCGVVKRTNPEMVDPVRTTVDTIGCPFFGLWTDAATRW